MMPGHFCQLPPQLRLQLLTECCTGGIEFGTKFAPKSFPFLAMRFKYGPNGDPRAILSVGRRQYSCSFSIFRSLTQVPKVETSVIKSRPALSRFSTAWSLLMNLICGSNMLYVPRYLRPRVVPNSVICNTSPFTTTSVMRSFEFSLAGSIILHTDQYGGSAVVSSALVSLNSLVMRLANSLWHLLKIDRKPLTLSCGGFCGIS
jgi:hypothetical protein